jgi:hypothetical protein
MSPAVPSLEIETVKNGIDSLAGRWSPWDQTHYRREELERIWRVDYIMTLVDTSLKGGFTDRLAEFDVNIKECGAVHLYAWNDVSPCDIFDDESIDPVWAPIIKRNYGCFGEQGDFYSPNPLSCGNTFGLLREVNTGVKPETMTDACDGHSDDSPQRPQDRYARHVMQGRNVYWREN